MRGLLATLGGLAMMLLPGATCAAQQTLPFNGKITTTVQILPTSEPWQNNIVVAGTGTVSHMGNVQIMLVQHFLDPTGAKVQSTVFEIIAPTGDKLFAHFTMGTSGVAPPPGALLAVQFSGTFYIDGGTGRFKGASGSADFSGSSVVYPPDANHPYPFGIGEFSWKNGTLILK